MLSRDQLISQENELLHVLVVSDEHLLGTRTRSALDVAWTDWQLRKAFRAAVAWARPDAVVWSTRWRPPSRLPPAQAQAPAVPPPP